MAGQGFDDENQALNVSYHHHHCQSVDLIVNLVAMMMIVAMAVAAAVVVVVVVAMPAVEHSTCLNLIFHYFVQSADYSGLLMRWSFGWLVNFVVAFVWYWFGLTRSLLDECGSVVMWILLMLSMLKVPGIFYNKGK